MYAAAAVTVCVTGQERRRRGEFSEQLFLGDVLAYRGEFRQAAECYQRAGKSSHALQMYTDLRMFDLAQVSPWDGSESAAE